MMIATLNIMPEEPCDFMKDYISMHYLDMTAQSQKENEGERRKRAKVGLNDLKKLRNEVDDLKD